MPFKSKAQRAYLFANEPEVAAEFAEKTPNEKKLPKRAAKKKATKKKTRRKRAAAVAA